MADHNIRLTKLNIRVFGAFELLSRDGGVPTLDAIAENAGCTKEGVRTSLDKLERIGWISRDDGRYESLKVTVV